MKGLFSLNIFEVNFLPSKQGFIFVGTEEPIVLEEPRSNLSLRVRRKVWVSPFMIIFRIEKV